MAAMRSGDRGEAAAADDFPGDDREEDLYHSQPRPRCRREVQGDPGILRQPGLRVGMGLGAVVIADQVQLAARVGLGDLPQEGQELRGCVFPALRGAAAAPALGVLALGSGAFHLL